MASSLTCNLCGKDFEAADNDYGVNLTIKPGPLSRYDGCVFDADFCCQCIDRLISNIVVNCAIMPLSESAAPRYEDDYSEEV